MLFKSGWHAYSQSMNANDLSLEALRVALAPLIARHAAFDGWSNAAAAMAAQELGVPAERAELVFPNGAIDMIDAWYGWIDSEMAERLPAETVASLKIRERITQLVLARLAIAKPDREAVRRALNVLARPANVARATRLVWRTVDGMWRQAGITSSDISYYTRRLTLSAVYTSTLLVWINDESEDQQETKAFLDRRIEGVMRFEKTKAQLKPKEGHMFSPVKFLGRLRYADR